MSRFRVLILGDFHTDALAHLKSHLQLDVQQQSQSQIAPEDLASTQILIIRSGTKIHEKLLSSANELKMIVTATSGFDHIDLDLIRNKQILAAYCPNSHVESVAQLALMLLLQLMREGSSTHKAVQNGHWRKKLSRGRTLNNLSLGIIGLGRIGQRVAQLAQAFQMQVQAYDPYLSEDDFSKNNVQRTSLIELLKTSDVISLHAPLTSETKHLINQKTTVHMNPDAYFINVARGALVDETELAVRMREGLLKGAAFDVFEKEPLARDSPLQELNNVIFSPHVGAYTESAFRTGGFEAAQKVIAFAESQPIVDSLPPATLWAPHLISR